MQILSIQLKNIKSHRDLELHFAPGINVLSGPNGVGKSTVFEAIGYALFGVDASSFVGNVERFLTIGVKKGEVAVVFQVNGGERFRVTRTVGTPARWLLAREVGGAFEVEEHKDNDETEARLQELLGLDNGRRLKEQFTLVIGPFQNEFLGPFVIKQATKRRDEFDAILGIDSWRNTFDQTKGLASATRNKIEVLRAEIGPLQEQAAALPERREAHKDASKDLAQAQQEFKKQQQLLKGLEARLVVIDQREATLKELGVEIDKLQERIANGKEMIGNQQRLLGEAEKAKQIVTENVAGKEAFEMAEKRLADLREQLKLQNQLEKEAAALDKKVETLMERHAAETRGIEQSFAELHNEEKALSDKRRTLAVDVALQQLATRLPEIRAAINAARTELGQLEGRRAALEEGSVKLAEGICPVFQEPCLNIAAKPPADVFSDQFAALEADRQRLCGSLLLLEKDEVEAARASDQLKKYEGQIQELEKQVLGLQTRRAANEKRAGDLATLQQEQAEVQQLLVTKQQALKAYDCLQEHIDRNEQEKKKYQPARDLYVAHQQQAAELAQRQAELKKFEELLAKLQEQLAAKGEEREAAGKEYDAEQHLTLREQKDALVREVGGLEQKVARYHADVGRLVKEIEKLVAIEREIDTTQARIKTYGEREELIKFLRNRVFKQVSGYLSERFREEISFRANRIYRTIAESDEELAWGDDYRIVLRDLVDGELRERNDDQLSGGQTMSAVVALRLAMLQTIGARIAFFDEPTSNLDAARRENLASAFRAIDIGQEEVTEHWYDQLFLISHDVAFTEVTDQTIELGREEPRT
ncbi:MAG: nuclease SbcCD subunit C [Desulfuromonadales bacterium GWD2_61_12]|nr:MAG: nuclease SbcCD subunit C [Desulfuromonadales bacterium GWD2_61_12]